MCTAVRGAHLNIQRNSPPTSEYFGNRLHHSRSIKESFITKRQNHACMPYGVDGSHFGRDKTLSKVSTKKEYDMIKVIKLL